MAKAPISLGVRSNPGRFPQAGNARIINGYAEAADDEGRGKWPIYASDGLTDFATLGGAGGVRAIMPVGTSELVVVAGRLIHTVLADGSSLIAGDMPTDGPVYMAYNGADVGIVSDGIYKCWAGGAVTEISDPDLIGPTSIDFLDQYMIFSQADGRWGWSELGDARLIDALDYVTAESNPDPVVRVMRHQRNVVAAGTRSMEWWSNTGGTSTFERVTATDVGVLAPGSMAVIDQTIAFVAHDGTVRLLSGYQAPRISTDAVDRFIAGVADKPKMTATSWTGRGHTFYALSDTSGTWVYDLNTGLWHERASYGMSRWRVHQAVEFGGRWIVGDYASPKLYTMSGDAYDEAGEEMVLTVQPPTLQAFPAALIIDALDIDVIPGQGAHPGTGAAQDVDPYLMVRWSDDGGITWKGERRVSTGQMGETVKSVRTTRLGTCQQIGRTFALSMSTKTARGLLGMTADVTKVDR